MKIKLFSALLALTLFPVLAQAQIGDITNPLNGRITVVDAGTCSTANSFVTQQLPQNASTTTVNLSGTFTATLTARLSNNGGATWTTGGAVAAGTTSFSTNGFTHICVDSTAFTSGTVLVSISTGILQVQSVVSGGSSSSSLSPAPIMGYYLSNACATGTIGTNGLCFNTPANTQRSNLCNYTLSSTALTCQTAMRGATASVTSNVATYSFPANIVASWAVGNNIVPSAFIGGDTFFNTPCVLTVVVSIPGATSISCPLVHANASSVATNPGIVTNTSAGPFTAFDAGTGNPNGAKRIDGYSTCRGDDSSISLSNNSPLVTTPTTISAFVSSLQVTISQTASNSAGTPNAACVTWGNPDDTAAAAMDLAMLSATQCPRAHLAAGYYWYNVPHHYNQPDACTREAGQVSTSAGGNLTYAAGYELDGRGNGTTIIHLPPGFPESGACTNGLSKLACFVVPLEAKFSNFMIEGGGNFTAANIPVNTNILEMDGPATLEYVTLLDFAANSGNSVCLAMYIWAQTNFINISGCGDIGVATSTVTSSATMFRTVVENPRHFAYNLGFLTDYASFNPYQHSRYNFICYDCWAYTQNLGAIGAQALMRVNSAHRVKLYHYRASKYIGALNINGIVGIQTLGASGGILDIQDSYLDMTAGGTATSTGDIGINDTAGYAVHVENSIIKGTASGNGYTGVAASKFNSNNGNILGAMSVNAGGLLSLSPTDDLSAATGVTPTCPTVTGATATCAAVAGSTNEKGTLRMTVSAAGTATGTVTMNFVGTFQQTTTPSCVFNPALTGTGAWNARATTFLSTRSSTAPIITWDNNAANLGNLTWDIDYTCTAR